MTAPTSVVHRQLDLPLGPGQRTLRLTVSLDEHGEADALIIAEGFGEGRGFHRPAWLDGPMRLPASCLPELVRALQELGEEAR